MSERTNRVRFYLISDALGKRQIEDIKDPITVGGDSYTLEEAGYYKIDRLAKVTLYEEAFRYINTIRVTKGPSHRVRLITEVKDDLDTEENWKRISDPYVDMYSLVFSEETDNPSVECTLISGGDLGRIEASFGDEFDTVGPDVPELPYVQLRLDPRKIIKRSRFISSDVEVTALDDQGATATAIPLELDYTSDRQHIGEISNYTANSSNDNYAALTSSGNLIIQNIPRDTEYVLNGTVEIRVSDGLYAGNRYLRMDLVRYAGGQNRSFSEIILPLDQWNGSSGDVLSYTFVDFKVILLAGESLGIMAISDYSFLSTPIKYKTT